MKKFIVEEFRKRKVEEAMKFANKPKAMSKETLNRLYPGKKEDPNSTTKSEKDEEPPKKIYNEEFIKKLIEYYGKIRPTDKTTITSKSLLDYWGGLTNKDVVGLSIDPIKAKHDIEVYFDEKYDLIVEGYNYKYGFKSYDPKLVLNWYKNELPDIEKNRRDINFDLVTLTPAFEEFCKKRRKEKEEYDKKYQEELKK